MAINNITGPPVEGENFFGREKELDSAWEHIKKGNSILLSAPRRVGKSSFAKKLLSFAEADNWQTLEIDLEEIKSEHRFIELFVEKLRNANWWKKATHAATESLSQILESVRVDIGYQDATATVEWKTKKTDLYTKLKNLLNHEQDTLIMVDEVTILLNSFLKNDTKNGLENVEYFLNWLRSFRQIRGTKIRWVFCSSIGIDNFTNRYNLSYTFNDVQPFTIGPFDEPTTKLLLQKLSESDKMVVSDDSLNHLVDKISWCLPYFTQVFYFHFRNLVITYNNADNIDTIEKAYQELIDSKELNTWDERLAEYAEYEQYSRDILKQTSKSKTGVSKDSFMAILNAKIKDEDKSEAILNKLLYMLTNDGYLIRLPDRKFAFRSPILRDFWHNRFV